MILVFPKEMYITILPSLYFLELEHFSQISSPHLALSHLIVHASSRPNIHALSFPIVHASANPMILAVPFPMAHGPSCPIVHSLSQVIIISSHPSEPSFNPFPKIGEE